MHTTSDTTPGIRTQAHKLTGCPGSCSEEQWCSCTLQLLPVTVGSHRVCIQLYNKPVKGQTQGTVYVNPESMQVLMSPTSPSSSPCGIA
jgi:hypothetical protein